MAQVKETAPDISNVKVRHSPTYPSGSRSAVEHWHQTLNGTIRTFVSMTKNTLDLEITAASPLLPWTIRHSARVVSRYMVPPSDKLTSYARRWGQPYSSPIASFAEAVNFKISASRHPKLTSSWNLGVWLGKDSLTNDHLVGCS